MRCRYGGETEKKLYVMLSFDAEFLADKVKVGSVRYPVRVYVMKILWCFRCQCYGHSAAVCKREMPRCAGGHFLNVTRQVS